LEHEILSLQLENANLRTALVLDTTQHTENPYTLLKAHIVGRDPSNINGYLYIDKGSARSLVINQPVISPNGLVGKIIHVGTHNSIIETIENQGFTVSAVDVNSGIHGVVKNNRALLFDYIRIGDSISIGDSIYTSGMSEQFPAGILVGVVETIAEPKDMFFKPVYITPSVHVNQLVYTYILIEEHSNEDEEIMEKIPNAPNQ
jgi:rod shape-determining protein MreC